MRWLAPIAAAALLAACSQSSAGNTAKLIGSQDVVLVDELDPGGGLARADALPDGGVELVGTPNKYLFVTSVDTNELRVLRLYTSGRLGRQFVPAPNPIETLSIPVISRPSMLAVDEGLHADGRRVTGSYVYAARPGSSVISIVGTSPSELRVVTPSPIPTPGPVTALTAWMGQGLTTLPPQTNLYVATFDGSRGAVYRVPLLSDPAQLRAAIANATPTNPAIRAEILFDVASESVMALQVMPPLAGRTVDGQPFCDTRECLAIATRRAAGQEGRTLLIDPQSLRAVPLDFGGPVRDFATIGNGVRLFGILDEEKCGSSSCGGAVAVDTLTAVGTAGFPRALDFSGQPMLPISTGDSLPTGIALAQGAQIRQTYESYDAGTRELSLVSQGYDLLGVVSSSNGELSFFDALAAAPIDYDARRTTISSATLQIPGTLDDGGLSYTGEDGGFLGFLGKGVLTETIPVVDDGGVLTEPWRIAAVANPDGGTTAPDGGESAPFVLDVSDGYFASQTLVVIFEGQLPGLVNQPTTMTDGTILPVASGYASRAAVGDRAVFLLSDLSVCGEARITVVGDASLTVDAVPSTCGARTAFSVRASGDKPYVVAADLEGYLGRGAVGDTLTYTRRYAAIPPGWSGVRPALRVTIGDSLLPITGAYWAFVIDGGLVPYRMAFDATNCASPYLPSRVILAQLPTLTDKGSLTYPWEAAGIFPSGNSVFEVPLSGTLAGRVTTGDGFFCYR
jgi:hypothetical protein